MSAMCPRTFEEILTLSESELGRCDIALVNLLCAIGLPGAEELDIPACLAKLDAWTEDVRCQTDENFKRFTPKTPRDTPGLVKCWTLCKVLRHWKGLKHHLEPPDLIPGQKYT